MDTITEKALWIKNPLALLADGAEGGIVIDQGKIVELVGPGQSPSSIPADRLQVFDAGNHVVLPGLINTHHHFYQTLTRACPPALNKPLFPWLVALYPLWARLTPDMMATASRLAIAELLLSGCTTAADHHYLFPVALTDAIDIQVEQARKLGIRMTVTRGSMSLGEDQGGLPPQSTVQDEQVILDDSQRLIRAYHDPQEGSMTQVALAPCSPFSVSTDLMRASAELARQHGVRLHTHLAETHDETDFCLNMFGQRPVDYLENVGWMADDVWLAHGIHFNDEEIGRLGAAGVGICHCPSSNMVLSSGIARTLELEAAGCPVGLGVDGSASNDGSNLVQEVRQALLIGRLRYTADDMTHHAAYRFATEGSARCLGRSDIGRIAPGMQADLALFKLDEPRFSGSGDPLAALLLCGAHAADAVMVKGEWRVRDGEITGLDMDRLMRDHHALGQALQGR
ncbi:8-oxoguanine deaminase [Sneathiella chinensis]|uniref:8-oxoguanine deaminase n=1 Tax=Sneathiella chinensis TaxID=349750 RepID=A0ABQ5UAF0_9PROT|nr:8-oxoguanine deaminase [Sneathiella chinensis]GLQ07541.1 8-oxoguanine deaminase [Sneathiella chinensis]